MLNTLIGLYAPTSGTAYMGSFDLSTDISRMHTKMGVCQQNDVLWDTLTGEEHLLFYGRIRGLRGRELQNEVNQMLKNVNLYEARFIFIFLVLFVFVCCCCLFSFVVVVVVVCF